MNQRIILAAVILVVILAGGFWFLMGRGSQSPSTTEAPTTNETTQAPQEGLSIVVDEQNDSGQSGLATLTEENGAVMVNLKLTGTASTVSQPAHFHSGTCEAPGPVVYPLTNVEAGESITTLEVGMDEFNSSLPLILNVHKSEAESTVYTACRTVEAQ